MVSVDIREKDRPCRFWTLTGRYSRRRVIRRRRRARGNLFIIKHQRSALTKRHRHCVVGWFSKLIHRAEKKQWGISWDRQMESLRDRARFTLDHRLQGVADDGRAWGCRRKRT